MLLFGIPPPTTRLFCPFKFRIPDKIHFGGVCSPHKFDLSPSMTVPLRLSPLHPLCHLPGNIFLPGLAAGTLAERGRDQSARCDAAPRCYSDFRGTDGAPGRSAAWRTCSQAIRQGGDGAAPSERYRSALSPPCLTGRGRLCPRVEFAPAALYLAADGANDSVFHSIKFC